MLKRTICRTILVINQPGGGGVSRGVGGGGWSGGERWAWSTRLWINTINSITVLGLHFVRSAATGNDGPWCYHRAFDRVM